MVLATSHTSSRFKRGDHLRVTRRCGYRHHGIYVNGDRVIQFGGRTSDKPGANIEAVSLKDFADSGQVEIVKHPKDGGWFGQWLPEADHPGRIVRRAEWLLEHHPAGRYNVIGWNCEHAANFCVNEFTESLQARRFFLLNAAVGAAVAVYVSLRSRQGRPVSWRLVGGRLLMTLATTPLYNYNIRRFWRDVGEHWRAYDRTVSLRTDQG
jgi:Lecithin retinol acyltransferase